MHAVFNSRYNEKLHVSYPLQSLRCCLHGRKRVLSWFARTTFGTPAGSGSDGLRIMPMPITTNFPA
ncbi:hypothetical protein BA177_04695 [Woeseia oceani]|uniref:Uncharacterized protein n=1 Tax=Woeseia oceani TaxID=1548547 RepID=A0A193LDT2_9GAMM|nr:hypothetical protein BA177_04695 [Woeseia oceani]